MLHIQLQTFEYIYNPVQNIFSKGLQDLYLGGANSYDNYGKFHENMVFFKYTICI